MHQLYYFYNPQFLPMGFLKNTRKIKQFYPEAAIVNLSRAHVFCKMLFCTFGQNHEKVPTKRSSELIKFKKRTLSMLCFEDFKHICRATILQNVPISFVYNPSSINGFSILWNTSQAASSYLRFTCSNSTLRILEQAAKYL